MLGKLYKAEGHRIPRLIFPSERTSEGLADGRNCGPLRKKKKAPYLVLSLNHSTFSFYVDKPKSDSSLIE